MPGEIQKTFKTYESRMKEQKADFGSKRHKSSSNVEDTSSTQSVCYPKLRYRSSLFAVQTFATDYVG
jgi:hypothetical protein